jgi:hypothetical protein
LATVVATRLMRAIGDCLRVDFRADFRAELLLRAVEPRDDALRDDDVLRREERLVDEDFRPRALLDALRALPREDDREDLPRRLADFDPPRFDRLDEREVLRDRLVFVAMS